ncbi:MAG: asparaginase [Burkholderiaceae bacterium]
MQSTARGRIVVLGTGGTIAGTSVDPHDNVGYSAAQIGIGQLVATISAVAGADLESEQVAQIDSKDMDHATWQRLARRVAHHLARAEVSGIVITHGTDTLEETAYFLQRVLAPAKPVVMTGAMRPATALLADGPQNLLDAVSIAGITGARGVTTAFAGSLHSAFDVRKVHSYRPDAFGSGDAGPIGRIAEGQLRRARDWPNGTAIGLAAIESDPAAWPRVEIVFNHAGASARGVDALLAQGIDGLVAAGTGNAKFGQALDDALLAAERAGVQLLRCSRCAIGPVVTADGPAAGEAANARVAAQDRTPFQARIDLLLQLLVARTRQSPVPG